MGVFTFVATVFFQVFGFLGDDNGFLSEQQTSLGLNVPVPGVQFKPYVPPEIAGQVPFKEQDRNFVCHYPSLIGWELCNGPDSRGCWLRDTKTKQPIFSQFDIETDYEVLWPPGITREYWLEVSEHTISPDGFPKAGQVFNETYPGPLIVIHVTNKLPDNGTTIHWHGIRQLYTNDADGVNAVTQCPIAQNQTYTYRFTAMQYGHTWYHSHYSLQYPNGVAGPLLIHGPTSANYDLAWNPIFVEDWVHQSAFTAFVHELNPPPLPTSDSILLGGQGQYHGSGSIFTKVVPKGKRILLRLINTSTDMLFIFSIDNHPLQVISTDFVPIEPYWTDSLSIAIGQRYSVIIETNQTVDNYWIRTVPPQNCSSNGTIQDGLTGILRYEGAPTTTLPTTSTQPGISYACEDEPLASLKPVVRWEVGSSPANNVTDSTYEVGLQESRGARRWTIGERPLFLNFSDPTLLSLGNKTFNPDYDVYKYDYENKWVYIIITGNGSLIRPVPVLDNSTRLFAGAAHPIHMHGHDFAILGRGDEPYDEETDPLTFNYHNPPRRDVALLPINGWLAIAFRSDNPGVWLLHCHIAWHASSGLALQLLERQDEILDVLGQQRVHAVERTCIGWDQWLKDGEKIDQEDSGI
ncbi:hypothetical protein VTN77DRAFT_4705 [Rasamsonia byssochlamydoides]|uniref:uncharacterized protein n=1 Tax=Rasamsonia byssochlamydoides TaxID=89139 RepID=UPI003743BF88